MCTVSSLLRIVKFLSQVCKTNLCSYSTGVSENSLWFTFQPIIGTVRLSLFVRWVQNDFSMCLIFISLITSEVEHFFSYLWAVRVFYSMNSLSFAHFSIRLIAFLVLIYSSQYTLDTNTCLFTLFMVSCFVFGVLYGVRGRCISSLWALWGRGLWA